MSDNIHDLDPDNPEGTTPDTEEAFNDPTEAPQETDAWGGQAYPRKGDTFYYITRRLVVRPDFVDGMGHAEEYCKCGNCFKTEADAQATLEVVQAFFTPIEFGT